MKGTIYWPKGRKTDNSVQWDYVINFSQSFHNIASGSLKQYGKQGNLVGELNYNENNEHFFYSINHVIRPPPSKSTYFPVKLTNPTAVSCLDDNHHFRHGIDGNPQTYFSLKGGIRDGWWMAQFDS